MKRRQFLGVLGGAITLPLDARAQQSKPVIGFLGSESEALFAVPLRIFRQGLGEYRYVEDQNVSIEYKWAEGRNERLTALAAELVHRQVRVIVAPQSTTAAFAAKKATATIPIVFFTGGNPVELGLVSSLSRPGGNVTGVTSLAGELAPKRLELLHQLVPAAKEVALLVNPTNPALMNPTVKAVEDAAHTLGLHVHTVSASVEREFSDTFEKLVQLRVGALLIAIDSFFTGHREILAALALRHGIPAIYQYRDFAEAGGVMSYGGSLTEAFRLVGRYTGRILNGEKPADLPVQQATKAELVINLKAAKSLGLVVSPALLARADEVIE